MRLVADGGSTTDGFDRNGEGGQAQRFRHARSSTRSCSWSLTLADQGTCPDYNAPLQAKLLSDDATVAHGTRSHVGQ
ncbi:hypothetical protein VNO78_16699 [Psophocarpus tetragonolobus]|uniref:Uncharacterized protein n=1 Tax=Psophocarpus tetragonolobus TaxID=3891 RepID=A0AAN9SMM1_PSOTE